MTRNRILALFMLVALLGGSAAEAFPLFGSSSYYNGFNNGGRYNNGCGRHHRHRHHRMW